VSLPSCDFLCDFLSNLLCTTPLSLQVNDYLQSGAGNGSPIRSHAARMETWLARLLAQLHASRPRQPKKDVPDITVTWSWVENLVNNALDMIDSEMRSDGCIGYQTASTVQHALIAAFVTGCFCPPPRIHVLTSLIHPRHNGRISCVDPDCLNGPECIGNHIEIFTLSSNPSSGDTQMADASSSSISPMAWEHFEYCTKGVKLTIVHHKNDR